MNKKQYNNVIEHTLQYEQSAQTDDSLATARAIFDNMGVALPQGDMKTVYETIKTDNYMGWKSCTMQEAQEAVDNGTAAIGISEDRIVVLSANDEEQSVTQTASVMSLDENTSAYAVAGLQYYSYSYGGTTGGSTTGSGENTTTTIPISYCGGSNYRDVTKHNMVLQNDGYYVCTRCGYRVKSPALQDQDVLNKSDYLTIASLYHEVVVLAEQAPVRAEALLAAIDYIRGLPENRAKYEYQGANGIYHPENSAKLKNVEMWIHVERGSCIREWQLMNVLFPLIGAAIPPPYSYMFSIVSTALMQEHPAATNLSGTQIILEYASELAGQKEILPKCVAPALGVLFGFDEVLNGDSSCGENCYNITLTLLCRDEGEECYQVDYHFPEGVETLGRVDACWVSLPGTAPYNPELLYEDRVNDRRYTFEE